MLGGVFVFRVIAASHMAAGLTQPQMDPGVAHLQAFLTAVSARRHIMEIFYMFTGFIHYNSSFEIHA
jgi:hypothetical protein